MTPKGTLGLVEAIRHSVSGPPPEAVTMAMAEHRVLDLVGLQLAFWLATIKGCLEATASLLAMVTMHQAVSVRLSPTPPARRAGRAGGAGTMPAAAGAAERPTTGSTPALAEAAATASWSWWPSEWPNA